MSVSQPTSEATYKGAERDVQQAWAAILVTFFLGLLLGAAVLFFKNIEWVFVYFLGAPWLLADVLQDMTKTPSGLFYLITLCYFGGLSAALGRLWIHRGARNWRLGVAMIMLVGHISLSMIGSRRLFAEFVDTLQPGALPAPEIWPKG